MGFQDIQQFGEARAQAISDTATQAIHEGVEMENLGIIKLFVEFMNEFRVMGLFRLVLAYVWHLGDLPRNTDPKPTTILDEDTSEDDGNLRDTFEHDSDAGGGGDEEDNDEEDAVGGGGDEDEFEGGEHDSADKEDSPWNRR